METAETPSAPSASPLPADLQRAGWLGRFPAYTEERYQAWLGAQIVPLARIAAAVSIPLWLAIPPIFAFVPDVAASPVVWVICVGHAVALALAITALTWYPDHVTLVVGSVLVVLGTDLMYLQANVWTLAGPGTVAAAVVFWCLLPPFLRLPFRTTVVVDLLLSCAAVGLLIAYIDDGHFVAKFTLCMTFLVTTVWIAFGAALVSEIQTRTKFTDEQLIIRQQALLVESQRLIRRYAPPAVADLLEHGDSSVDTPTRRRVTVLFSDLVGFTELADRLDPEALTQIVNEYLATLAGIIERHQGTLNEFAGDGVMALFGAPVELHPESQVEAALAAALDIQATLPELNRGWLKLGADQELRTRIGINTGVLSVGSFGSEGRATYTGIGLQTNIAARIQSACEPGGILLSHTSWQLVKDTVECEARGEITVKGVHFPIQVFAPSRPGDEQDP